MVTCSAVGRDDATKLLAVRDPAASFRRFKLRVVDGPDAGAEHVTDAREVSVGTSPGNDLVLRDGTVSRHHCAIVETDRGVLLRDLGSTNGTKLEGHRVEGAYLNAGATFQVGITKIRFEPLNDVVHEPLSGAERCGRMLGRSAVMRRTFALAEKVAGTDATVLILGETGTGKGVLAEAIHRMSKRAAEPFVVVDCSAIAPSLIESELFGHVKGAFTGAHTTQPGSFVAARRGTVFLDEVGELPLSLQPKLLRALEERMIKPVGGTDAVRLDVRVIAATNRDLRREVNQGTFRADLFFRLNVMTIALPSLRDHKEDIPLLVQHVHEQFADGLAAPQPLVDEFSKRDWHGNVRELRNAVEQAALLGMMELRSSTPPPAPSAYGGEASAPETFDPNLSFRQAKELAISAWEKGYLRELLALTSGNLSRAAREAKTDRNHLRELLKKHGLQTRDD